MTSKVMVSKAVWTALSSAATAMFAADPTLEKQWLNQCCTSKETRDLGIADLQTDYDWLLAFFAWHHGAAIPRELEH